MSDNTMSDMTIICGLNPVLEALRAPASASARTFHKIMIQAEPRHPTREAIRRLALAKRIPVEAVPTVALDRVAGQGQGASRHQGVVGLVSAMSYTDLDEAFTLASRHGTAPFLLVVDGVEDPRNLGAIIRTAEAAGVHGVVVPRHRAAGLTPTVAKTSAGAVEHLPVIQAVNLVQVLEEAKRRGYWVYGLAADAPKSYLEVDYTTPLALVVGGEGRGMRRLVAEHCDGLVSIPMHGRVASLNVSVATGIVAYEVCRQRGKG